MSTLLANRRVESADLRAVIDARVRRGDTTSFIAIVPTRRRASLQRRRWLLDSPGASAPRFPLFTLSDLAALLAESALPRRRTVSEELQFALLEQAVRTSSLRYFTKRHATLPRGTLQTILHTIVRLKEAGVLPAHLRDALERNNGRDREKIEDLGIIYDAYEQLLEGKFRDAPGTLLELNTALKDQPLVGMLDECLPGWSVAPDRLIVVEGFSEFRKPECEFLSSCAGLTGVTAAIISDHAEGNDSLFGHLSDHLERLQRDGYPFRTVMTEQTPPWTRLVQSHCFSGAPAAAISQPKVSLVSARNRRDEAALVARIVKGLVKERPSRDLSKICIATRLPGSYTTLFREAFADAGIPVNITDRFPLAGSAVAVGFIALLDLVLRDFRTRDIARALASPYFTFLHHARRVSGDTLLTLAAQLRIVGGYRAWVERLETRRTVLQSAGDREDRDVAANIDACTLAIDDVTALHDALSMFDAPCTPREFERHAEELFRRCDTTRNILRAATTDTDLLERETRAFHALEELIADVCAVLADQGGNTPLPLSEFARHLRAAVAVSRFNVRPRAGKGVLITSPEETRGLDIEVMVIAGLIDGEFPLPYAPEIFLSRNLQTSRQRHGQDEHYLFYQAAVNWTERLVLTHPREDDNGKDFVISPFIDALANLARFDGALPDGAATDIIATSSLHQALGARARSSSGTSVPAEIADLMADIGARVALEVRRHAHDVPALEGRIGKDLPPVFQEELQQMRGLIWSSSQLELYGKCPFRYFASRLLRVEERDELEEGLSPQERGTIVHDILYTFFMQRRAAGAPPLQSMNDAEARDAERSLMGIAAEIVASLDIRHPFWQLDIDRLLGLVGTDGILRKFLRMERARSSDATPSYFEVQFGSSPGALGRFDSAFFSEAPVDFGTWKLRGKMDRIDVSGTDCTIVDYKTGGIATRTRITDGTSLQLPLYIRALQSLLAAQPGIAPGRGVAGGMYYKLSRDCEINPGLMRPERLNAVVADGVKHRPLRAGEFEGYIDAAFTHVDNFLDGIARGAFQLTPPELRAQVCNSCAFHNMCRVRDEHSGGRDIESETDA